MKVMMTGGGTGGHVNPALAIAGNIKQNQPDAEIIFVGTSHGIENKLVPKEGYKLEHVEVQGFKRKLTPYNIKSAWLAFTSPLKAKKLLKEYKPDLVVGTGGYVSWVSHPGGDGIEYTVNIRHGSSPIIEGIEDFHVCSEHYYLHIDPAVEVLATTRFPLVNYYHVSNKPVDMPVAWTKFWGNGRVFYTSLGHHDDVFDKSPEVGILMKRGMLWAAEGKKYAEEHHLTTERFENTAKMY